MTGRQTRAEAARALGVAVSADSDTCKRAYRRLAREHHPDVGGDPGRFQLLTDAFETLATNAGGPSTPVVSRGTPSRPAAQPDDGEVVDLTSVDWTVGVAAGRVRLDRDRVAAWLVGGHRVVEGRVDGDHSPDRAADPRQHLVRSLSASSRAPGSRLNRLAHLLAPELTARLQVKDVRDDRGQPRVIIEIVGGNRRARRALDRVGLQGVWVRTRRSTTTLLRTTLSPSADQRATAIRVTERLSDLLDELGWPLSAWTLDRA